MKKKQQRILTGLAGATMILSSAAAQADEAVFQSNAPAYTAAEGETVSYRRVANVQGGFRFDQNCLPPTDDVFSLFGTVLTGACAKPAFAFENQQAEDHYINVGGKIRKAYSINLKDAKETEQVSLCACATGSVTANVKITGVLLSDVLTLADMDADVNTLKIIGSDGYGTKAPLSYALEKKAMIVYRINDETIPSGTQFWLPATVAKYFTRDVVDVELLAEKETPEIEQRADELRAEVAIMNYADDAAFHVGEEITFEGYADDCGDPIAAVDFSLDGGETWTTYETAGATAERWVYWNFSYAPQEAGTYQLSVRARTESGRVSKLAANLVFEVAQAEL